MVDLPPAHQAPAANVQDLDRFDIAYIDGSKAATLDMRTVLADAHHIERSLATGLRYVGAHVELLQIVAAAHRRTPDDPRWQTAHVDGLPYDLIEPVLDDYRDQMWLLHPTRPWNQTPQIAPVVAGETGKPVVQLNFLHGQARQRNPLWRDLANYTDQPELADLANLIFDYLLFVPQGNQTINPSPVRTGEKGKGQYAFGGAAHLDGTGAGGRTFVIIEGPNLAATLMANLTVDLATGAGHPTFVDRAKPDPTDALWLLHAADTSLLLVGEHPNDLQVWALPSFWTPDTGKLVRDAAARSLPFTLRHKEGAKTTIGHNYMFVDPDVSMFDNLRRLYSTVGNTNQLYGQHGHVLRISDRRYPHIPVTAVATNTVRVEGSQSPRVAEAATLRTDPAGFFLSDDQMVAFMELVNSVGDVDSQQGQSIVNATKAAIRNAVAPVPEGENRGPAAKKLVGQLGNQATAAIWAAAEPIIAGRLNAIRNGDNDGTFTDSEWQRLTNAALDAYDLACAPYAKASRTMMTVIDQRNNLRARLWREPDA